MRVSISYTAPVQVIVDLDSGRVDRVVVIDEGATRDMGGLHENADTYRPVDLDTARKAYAIADQADEWPAWDVGF